MLYKINFNFKFIFLFYILFFNYCYNFSIYENTNYDFIINSEINDIIPINNQCSEFKIRPELSNGLFFDNKTGIISGKPNNVLNKKYVISCKDNSVTIHNEIIINIWKKPKVVNCGFVELTVPYIVSDKFKCYTDTIIQSYSIKYDPVQPEGVNFDTYSDELIFNNYKPIGNLEYNLLILELQLLYIILQVHLIH